MLSKLCYSWILLLVFYAVGEENQQKYHLNPIFIQQSPVVQVVLDGFGIGVDDLTKNPVVDANSPYLYTLRKESAAENLYLSLQASSEAVGLPAHNNGNSEAGHITMAALKIYRQGTTLVDDAIKSGSLFKTSVWNETIVQPANRGKTIHFMGQLSDGNCFSHINHLFGLIEGAAESGVKKIRVHLTLDGVDVATKAMVFVRQLESRLADLKRRGVDAQIASGGGRAATNMVKSNPAAVKRGWNAMHGLVEKEDVLKGLSGTYTSAEQAITKYDDLYPQRGDLHIPPFVIVDKFNNPVGPISDGDTMVNFNFRGDYQMLISEAFTETDDRRVSFPRTIGQEGPRPRNVTYVSLMQYDTSRKYPPLYLVDGPKIEGVLMDYMIANNKRCYSCSCTYKYEHVTKFYNGNDATVLDPYLDVREKVIGIPDNMIEQHPEMKAKEVTDMLIAALRSGKFDFLRVNLANMDMVGHTGNFTAMVKAVHYAMESLELIEAAVKEVNGTLVIHSDHGNVEEGWTRSHSQNPVPFIIRDYTHAPGVKGEYRLVSENDKPKSFARAGTGIDAGSGEDASAAQSWGLSNIGATLLNLVGLETPAGEDIRESLLVFEAEEARKEKEKEKENEKEKGGKKKMEL